MFWTFGPFAILQYPISDAYFDRNLTICVTLLLQFPGIGGAQWRIFLLLHLTVDISVLCSCASPFASAPSLFGVHLHACTCYYTQQWWGGECRRFWGKTRSLFVVACSTLRVATLPHHHQWSTIFHGWRTKSMKSEIWNWNVNICWSTYQSLKSLLTNLHLSSKAKTKLLLFSHLSRVNTPSPPTIKMSGPDNERIAETVPNENVACNGQSHRSK